MLLFLHWSESWWRKMQLFITRHRRTQFASKLQALLFTSLLSTEPSQLRPITWGRPSLLLLLLLMVGMSWSKNGLSSSVMLRKTQTKFALKFRIFWEKTGKFSPTNTEVLSDLPPPAASETAVWRSNYIPYSYRCIKPHSFCCDLYFFRWQLKKKKIRPKTQVHISGRIPVLFEIKLDT